MNGSEHRPAAGSAHRWHVLIVLGVCAAVYFPFLGGGGLTYTEGHRAIPAWEMLESGNWRVTTLFSQIYLRKPPGVPWAIAAASKVFGETELAARLPSALAMTGMSLLAMLFASRWFGRGAGLAAGVATALTPWFWSSGRSAEIEAVNNFFSCASVLLVIELLVNRETRPWWGSLVAAVSLGAAMTGAALAKGPAGFAAIGSAVVVGMMMVGATGAEPRAVARVRAGLWLLVAVLPAAAVLGVVYRQMSAEVTRLVEAGSPRPVVQSVTEFLWSEKSTTVGGMLRILTMPIVALGAALPASLGLLASCRPGASWREGMPLPAPNRIARALRRTCVVSLLGLAILGVGNHRYAMPSLTFVPLLVGFMWSRPAWTDEPAGARRILALPRKPGLVAVIALLICAAVWIGVLEPRARGKSGREAGIAMAGSLTDRSMVWADQMVESRPEALWYAKAEAARRGLDVKVRWVPGMAIVQSLPHERTLKFFLLLRDDEEAVYAGKGFLDRLTKVWEGRVHKYACSLYRFDPERLRAR